MKGFVFTQFREEDNRSPFQKLFDLFMELLQYTSGDATEALDWLTQLDRKYGLTNNDYSIGDFIDELKEQGYLQENESDGAYKITAKSEQTIRKRSLDEIFGKLKKAL
jgi:predicted transcriptional regulator